MTESRTKFCLAEDVRYRRFGEEGIVLRQEEAEIMVLNETGIRVLALAAEGTDADDIVDRILADYDVNRATLQSDVDQFLAELLQAGILTQSEASSKS